MTKFPATAESERAVLSEVQHLTYQLYHISFFGGHYRASTCAIGLPSPKMPLNFVQPCQLHAGRGLERKYVSCEKLKTFRRLSILNPSLSINYLRSPDRRPTKINSQLTAVNDFVLQVCLCCLSGSDIDEIRMCKTPGLT